MKPPEKKNPLIAERKLCLDFGHTNLTSYSGGKVFFCSFGVCVFYRIGFFFFMQFAPIFYF